MVNDKWYDYFLEALLAKFPKKVQLTRALMELLELEREAVYRRLRKDVVFHFDEIVTIAAAWNISLDKISNISTGLIPFQMQSINYVDYSKQEKHYVQQSIQSIHYIRNFPDAEAMDICNKLPRSLFTGFDSLYKFYLFKWIYQYGNEKDVIPFSQVSVLGGNPHLKSEFYQATKLVPNTSYILDRMLFEYLIHDIQYFHSVQMITDKEKELIKKDLHKLLDYMLEVANRGYFPETQNKVNFYISQLNINTNYSYLYAPDTKVCFIHVFDKYEIQSFDADMVTNFKTWMQLKKRTSIQISEVDEKRRIEFFSKQHKLVDSL
ncbi:MAG: hypothetical protein FWH36_08135 [Lentimicrobiaceae bacterium]|nr:hypothetical protein [Lentimicrobiaceae bacterium]